MATSFELSAEIRHASGKSDSRRIRRLDNKVPAIIYGAGKTPVAITLEHHHLKKSLQNEAFYSHILTLKIGDTEERVVLKDLMRHPSKPIIMHADFMRISATEKLTMHVPLHFLNEDKAHGVKLQNGIISHLLNEVEIKCLPADLPEYIEVDLTELKLDETIHLSDLKLPKGVELVVLSHQEDRPIVSIHKLSVSDEPEGPVVIPSAEVPVVGKPSKDDSAGGAEGSSKKK